MRFLIDANLSPRIAEILTSGGHDAPHVRDVGLLTATDEKIMAHALLLANLPTVVADLAGGSVVSLSTSHLRVRRLPL